MFVERLKEYSKSCKSGKSLLQCEVCGKIRKVNYQPNHESKSDHLCKKCWLSSNRTNGFKKGIEPWNKGNRKRKATKSEYVNYHGYISVNMGEEGYRLKHHLVVEEAIKRRLTETEVVHHIDGNKLNNNLSNLYLCKDMSDHRSVHRSLELVAFELVRQGVIQFHQGNYYLPLSRELGETLKGKPHDNTEPSLKEEGVSTIRKE
jgi:hypothetical protein